jgi:outer membrane receptor for ferrienterochelin and colicins
LNRDSYYGANKSLSDYGNSKDRTVNVGAHYNMVFHQATFIVGVDNVNSFLLDKKLGYPDYDNAVIENDSIVYVPHVENTVIANQSSITTGVFAQYNANVNKLKVTLGARIDRYEIKDFEQEGGAPKSGNVFSPRLSLMYEISKEVKARISYSQGYRAPQIFDEDLHINTSGSRQVIHKNAPGLKQETSHSYMASVDYNGLIGTVYTGLLVEAFHTRLADAFASHTSDPDSNGVVTTVRYNASGAVVQGFNFEFKLKPLKDFMLTSGYTIQTSLYEEPQEDFNEQRFFRTPNQYGYIAMDWDFVKNLCFSTTTNFTGSMLMPYYGPEIANPETGELRTSESFFDVGFKFEYNIALNGTTLRLSTGVKNLLNSYQSDFDSGIDRDPGYIYGPFMPRTFYFGIKVGNFL